MQNVAMFTACTAVTLQALNLDVESDWPPIEGTVDCTDALPVQLEELNLSKGCKDNVTRHRHVFFFSFLISNRGGYFILLILHKTLWFAER